VTDGLYFMEYNIGPRHSIRSKNHIGVQTVFVGGEAVPTVL
jgi:hypothetical protein